MKKPLTYIPVFLAGLLMLGLVGPLHAEPSTPAPQVVQEAEVPIPGWIMKTAVLMAKTQIIFEKGWDAATDAACYNRALKSLRGEVARLEAWMKKAADPDTYKQLYGEGEAAATEALEDGRIASLTHTQQLLAATRKAIIEIESKLAELLPQALPPEDTAPKAEKNI